MRAVFALFIALAAVTGLTGCFGFGDEIMVVRLHLEVPERGLSDGLADTVTLERSRLQIRVSKTASILERNILDVDLVRVENGRLALRMVLDGEGRRELYRLSVAHRGRFLVLRVNGVALGARRLDGPIADGIYFTFTELPPEEMGKLAEELKKNAEKVQEIRRERSSIR